MVYNPPDMGYIFPWCSPLEAPEEPEWAYAVWKNGRKLWKIPIFLGWHGLWMNYKPRRSVDYND